MSQYNTTDSLSRILSVIKLMANDDGATVTEISRETGIDRWTVRDMIDRLEGFSPDGNGLCIEELQNRLDKRQTRYHIPKDRLWTMTLPGMDLTDEESLLLTLFFAQADASPILRDPAEKLRKKLGMFRNIRNYEIMNISSAGKIATKQTRQIMLAILKAIHEGKCINFRYKPVKRDITEYRLMPLGVFKYDSGYYLAAQKLPDGEYRTFGLERVTEVPEIIDYSDKLPERVGYEDKFNDPFGPFGHKAEFEAVMKFDSFHGFYNLEKNWPDAVKIEILEDESVLMRAKTHSYPGIKKWVLGFGSGVEVLEPEWFRNAIRDEHLKAAGMYPLPVKSEGDK